MILADTSVWIEHLRRGKPVFADRLSEGLILVHPCVAGELACGNLKDRAAFLFDFGILPAARVATNAEVMRCVEERELWGLGLGWTDAHLLASSLLSRCRFWTLDKRLGRAASDLGLT